MERRTPSATRTVDVRIEITRRRLLFRPELGSTARKVKFTAAAVRKRDNATWGIAAAQQEQTMLRQKELNNSKSRVGVTKVDHQNQAHQFASIIHHTNDPTDFIKYSTSIRYYIIKS